ncbi:MAG: substrate-binding periplasmic protein [Acidimicrobiales bacterium]
MKSRVRIGYQADFPPFMYDDGRPAGLVIDALAPAAEALHEAGVTIDWKPLLLGGQERSLAEEQVDLLAGLGVTTDRAARLVFGEPLVRTGGALFAPSGASVMQRIVTPTAGPLRQSTIDSFPDCEVLDAEDYPDALAKVLAGHADAAALNIHVGRVLAEREHRGSFELPEERFTTVELAPAYLQAHDNDLRRLIDEHSNGLDG